MHAAGNKDQDDLGSATKPVNALGDRANQEALTAPSQALAAVATRPPRDRIVILGRRRAGKTVFLARLYKHLWSSTTHFHMRALSGDSHAACIEVIDELESGRWPASTLGSQYTDIEITYNGTKRLLVALDYPGEVFRRAFVENANTEDARELLDHVDRAAAVILLLDPGVVHSGASGEVIDDEYGMAQAIYRIREWPGSKDVPIVIVLTKCDLHKQLLRDSGGLVAYATSNYSNLLRAMDRFKIFASAAVFTKLNLDGERVPDLTKPPIGVIEPLEYCLRKIMAREEAERERQAREEQRVRVRRFLEEQHEDKKRSVVFWSIFWSVACVLLFGVALVTWMVAFGTQ